MRARCQRLRVVVDFDRLSGDSFDLLFELRIDLVDVLRSDKDARPLVGGLLETSLCALGDSSCQDVDSCAWKLRDVLADSVKHACGAHMVAHFDKALSKLERVHKHQFLVKVVRNLEIVLLDVFVRVKQHIVGVLVVAEVLFLLRDIDRDLDSLLDVADSSVQFERPLRLFWNVVGLAHEVVDKLMCERLDLDLADHLDHVRDLGLAFVDVEFERFLVVLALLVVLGGFAPLRLAFEELCDFEVLVDVLLVDSDDDVGVLVHFLVRLGNDKGLFSLASKH